MYRKPLDVYPYLRCGHGATLPTARLTRHGDDFLHEGVGCLPVAQVTVASDANKFHHNLHRPRDTVVQLQSILQRINPTPKLHPRKSQRL